MYHNNRQLLEGVLKRYENIKKIKISLEIDEAEGYPSESYTTYTLLIIRNTDLIFKRHFSKNNANKINGEEELCLIAIDDIMHYGLDRIERDFDDR